MATSGWPQFKLPFVKKEWEFQSNHWSMILIPIHQARNTSYSLQKVSFLVSPSLLLLVVFCGGKFLYITHSGTPAGCTWVKLLLVWGTGLRPQNCFRIYNSYKISADLACGFFGNTNINNDSWLFVIFSSEFLVQAILVLRFNLEIIL